MTVAAIGASFDAGTVTLLVLYPLVDVAAAIIDLRTSQIPMLYANIVISTLAIVGLALAATDDITTVLRVWGAGDATSLKMAAGYAGLGGLFFLAAAVKLSRQSNLPVLCRSRDQFLA